MEIPQNVPHTPHPALAIILAHPDLFSRQGVVEMKYHGPPARRRGPYFSLRFRESGRHRSIYLGREGPLIQQVRALLAQLQDPIRRTRASRQARRQLMSILRGYNANLAARLGAIGLRMKGFEVRGWRGLRLPR